MTDSSFPEPAASGPVPTDADRQQVVDRIQQALVDDRIAFDEVDDRFELVYAASTMAELERVVADLPAPSGGPPAATARHLAPGTRFSLIGDVKIGGWLAVGDELRVFNIIGDVTIDLSSAHFEADGVTITAASLIGDVKVILPDGARVQFEALNLIGDSRQSLSPPVDHGPLVRIRGVNVIGDVVAYSLSLVPPGPLRRLWAALRRDGGRSGR